MLKDKVKKVRQELKRKFPKFKFSVTMMNHNGVNVNIMQGPMELGKHESINHYHVDSNYKDNEEKRKFLKKVIEISDIATEYYETSDYGRQPDYYLSVSIGKWDKEYIKI